MTEIVDRSSPPSTAGKIFHWAMAYDLLLRVFWGRSEQSYRDKVVHLAGLTAGESVLDVGCGTGTLAITAKWHVGRTGKVIGIDASPEMIARARGKAARTAPDVDFQIAAAEALPFSEATFDVVLSTTMLHCLPEDARRRSVREMRRVLKPGGRLLIVDFGGPVETRHSLIAHLRHHRHFDLHEVLPALGAAGLERIQVGALGFSDLQFVLARKHATAAVRGDH